MNLDDIIDVLIGERLDDKVGLFVKGINQRQIL